jgi:hypothetical protein
MDWDEWTLLLGLSASILPGVEGMKLLQRMLAKGQPPGEEGWLGPTSHRG